MTVKFLMDWPDSRDGKNYVAGNLLNSRLVAGTWRLSFDLRIA